MGSSNGTAASGLERVLKDEDRSLRWLAIKLELDPGYVWKMVRGQRPITDEFKSGAARVLDRAVDDLFPAEASA